MGGLGKVVLAIVCAASAALCSCANAHNDTASGRDRTGSPAPQHSTAADDWIPSVCKLGTYGERTERGQTKGYCVSNSSSPSPMVIGKYASHSLARNYAAMSKCTPYATNTDDSGTVWLFQAYGGKSGHPADSLHPLEDYGFQIEAAPCATSADAPASAPSPPSRHALPVPHSAAADTRSPTATFRRFQSQTGNIACEFGSPNGEGIAVCEIRQNAYGAAQAKPNCQPQWVTGFALRQGRAVVINCYPDSVFEDRLPVQSYGLSLTAGSITCAIDETTGVHCSDASTGRYFTAGRQGAKWG